MKINFVCPLCECSQLQEVVKHGDLIVTGIDITTRSLNYQKLYCKASPTIDSYKCASCAYIIPETDIQSCEDNTIRVLYEWLESKGMLSEEE